MDARTLLSAIAVGVGIGVVGRLVLPGPKAAPVWLTLAPGVSAALLGSIVLRPVGVDPGRGGLAGSLVQMGFAVTAVVLGVVTAGRRCTKEHHGRETGPLVTAAPGVDGQREERHDGRTGGAPDEPDLRQLW